MSNNAEKKIEEQFVSENENAEKFIAQGDLPSAAKIIVAIVEKNPSNWRAFNNMGIISWQQQAWEDAFFSFKHSADLKPDYTDTILNLFDAALKLKRIPEILSILKKGLECSSDDEEISILTKAIEEQGDDIYFCDRALAIGIYNPAIEEAKKLLEDGQLYAAMDKFISINDTEGTSAETFCGLGIISYHQKRYKDAFSLFFESIKLNPIKSDTFLNLIDAAKECGKIEDARKIFEIYKKELHNLEDIAEEFEKIATIITED